MIATVEVEERLNKEGGVSGETKQFKQSARKANIRCNALVKWAWQH